MQPSTETEYLFGYSSGTSKSRQTDDIVLDAARVRSCCTMLNGKYTRQAGHYNGPDTALVCDPGSWDCPVSRWFVMPARLPVQ